MESEATDAPPLTLLDLPSSLILEALNILPPSSSGLLACSTRSLCNVAHDETLRKKHLLDMYGVSLTSPPSMMTSTPQPCTKLKNEPPTYNETFKSWTMAFPPSIYKSEVVRSASQAWRQVERFLQASCLPILHSLLPGADEDQLVHLETSLNVKLPPSLKVLYRFHNGQQLAFDDRFDKAQKCPARPQVSPDASIAHGLFGGVSFYDNFKCVRMLSLARSEYWTSRLRHHSWLAGEQVEDEEGWEERRGRLVVFAASFDLGKIFVVDCLSSEVLMLSGGRLQSCCPASGDGVLAWFSEFANRLEAGWYPVRVLHESLPFDAQGISLFAEKGPGVSIAVTRGVQVKVSVVYAAEITRDDQHTFAYSVRLQLLPREEQMRLEAGAVDAVSSCQLNTRHWQIYNDEGVMEDEIRGEAVIGLFPHLQAGGTEFRYQSCTRAELSSKTTKDQRFVSQAGAMPALTFDFGRMSGDFGFVEGSRSMPTGPTFDVICPSFSLAVQGGFLY